MIFSAPMVRAILDGRKSQTRRVLKPQPDTTKISAPFHPELRDGRSWVFMARDDFPGFSSATAEFLTPYAIGDRLWVREAWRVHKAYDCLSPRNLSKDDDIWWEADRPEPGQIIPAAAVSGRYRHAHFMPRWASRLTLTVTDVRVQRLVEISEADAFVEGACRRNYDGPARDAFRDLWNAIHGPNAWAANPWVAAYTFSAERRNIDAGSAP